MATVEQLYKDFGVLADAKDKAGEHEKEYQSIIAAVKGGASEKRLASQFITRFFKFFPTLAEQAIDALLDLCEDEDLAIRKQAIKDLPALCKHSQEHLPRLADVLTQLLQSDEPELGIVQTSLLTLCKMDIKGAILGLMAQILQGEDLVRERAISFLGNKLMQLSDDVITKEVEDLLVEESRKVLQDVTGDEFLVFMKILSGLNVMQTLQGRQQLVEIIVDQAELDKEFEPTDSDCVDKLMQCIRHALPFYSKNVHSNTFIEYMCDHVLPVFSQISSHEEEKETKTEEDGEEKKSEKPAPATPDVDIQLELVKLFAELCMYSGEMDRAIPRTQVVFDRLLEYMPLPPGDEDNENSKPNDEPRLQFSYVECLMYAFHRLASRCPEFLTSDDNAERLKDFRLRLQYFARGVQVYIKQLRVALQGKTGDALKTDENKIKVMALKTTNNINVLIKDLFHNPPSFKTTINLSWKPLAARAPSQSVSPGQKRKNITPVTFESDGSKQAKLNKGERAIYSPPSGKYSEKAGTYAPGRGRGRGFRRGGFGGRGRGGYRGNRW